MPVFVKGLIAMFLIAPFALYLMIAVGGGDDEVGFTKWAKTQNFAVRLYFLYYPLVSLVGFVLFILYLTIMAIGKDMPF